MEQFDKTRFFVHPYNREKEEKEDSWNRADIRSYRKFVRRFKLSKNVKMQGWCGKWVLTIIVPKEEEKRPQLKSIQISS